MKIDVTLHVSDPPPQPSPTLAMWLEKIAGGWRPNRRIGAMGWEEAAEFYGVYAWELFNVIRPAIREAKKS